jgi:hypothetical protein
MWAHLLSLVPLGKAEAVEVMDLVGATVPERPWI